MLTVSLVKSVILFNFGHMAGLSGQLRLEMVVMKNWRGWSIGNEIRKIADWDTPNTSSKLSYQSSEETQFAHDRDRKSFLIRHIQHFLNVAIA